MILHVIFVISCQSLFGRRVLRGHHRGCFLEKLVVIDWVHTGLALDIDVECTIVISLMYTDRIGIVVNGDKGFQGILQS